MVRIISKGIQRVLRKKEDITTNVSIQMPFIPNLTLINLVATVVNAGLSDGGSIFDETFRITGRCPALILRPKTKTMKKLFIPLCLLAMGAQAQQQGAASVAAVKREGKVTYEVTRQMRRPANLDPEVAARIPAARTDVFELLFGNDQSLWRSVPRTDGDNGTVTAPGMVMRMAGTDDMTYFNFPKGERIDKRELFDNDFLVVDTIARLNWKLGEDTKNVLGHLVRKATAQRIGTRMGITMENGEMKRVPVTDTSTITAWYTTDVPVSVGPQDFAGQLPGLVLEVDVNNGRTVFKAVEMTAKVSLSNIKEPKGGKRYTPAEFDKERDRVMEEMRKNMPPGAQIRMGN
jgi:GLPGLI family protein